MKIKIVVHEAEEGGFWAEVPAIRQDREYRPASIPIHGNKPLKTGLLRHLAKLAELSDQDF
jgi:hypothetical protein